MMCVTECDNTKRGVPWSRQRHVILLSSLCLLPVFLLNVWLGGNKSFVAMNTPIFSAWNSSSNRTVTILLWHWPFGRSFSLQGDVCWYLYRIPNCRLVNQRSLFPQSDMVVFHNRELVKGTQKLPFDLPRPPGQRWAWMSLEAPENNGNLRPLANVFNVTMSYRRDADITIPYGKLQPKEDGGQLAEDIPINKSLLVCWVVSNYRSQHKRSRVFKELSAVVPVKVYGSWTKTPLPPSGLLPMISRCYFYLAFENSVSKDYISEKLWQNAYLGGAVPVVVGPPMADYKAVAPPNSYIHVDEFASVKDLGTYLQTLADDKKRYKEYFTWKNRWKVELYTDWRERLCQVCTNYNTLPQHKIYTDLQTWVNAIHT